MLVRPPSLRLNPQRFHCLGQRPGLQHHAFASAERTIVDGAMPVMRKVAQVVHAHHHQPLDLRAPHNAVLKNSRKESWKDGDDFKPHRDLSSSLCRLITEEFMAMCFNDAQRSWLTLSRS